MYKDQNLTEERDRSTSNAAISSAQLSNVYMINQSPSGYSIDALITKVYGKRTIIALFGYLFALVYILFSIFSIIFGSTFSILGLSSPDFSEVDLPYRILLLIILTTLIIFGWSKLSEILNLAFYKMTFLSNTGVVGKARGLGWGNVWKLHDTTGDLIAKINIPLRNYGRKFNFTITISQQLYRGVYHGGKNPAIKVSNSTTGQLEYSIEITEAESRKGEYLLFFPVLETSRLLKLTSIGELDQHLTLLTAIVCIQRFLPTRIAWDTGNGG